MNERMEMENANWLHRICRTAPAARAIMRGTGIRGTVDFYQTQPGVLVVTEMYGLPHGVGGCSGRFFALHIHQGGSCTGNAEDPFADAKGHYNPFDCEHPAHAGDLPPLLGNNGYAWSAVLTGRFGVSNIIGHTVILHEHADDFTSQPAGHAGNKIACGVIDWLR